MALISISKNRHVREEARHKMRSTDKNSTGLAALVAALMLGIAVPAGMAVAQSAAAQDQAAASDFQQVQLTEAQVKGFIAAQKDLNGISDQLQAAGDNPDPKLQAKLDDIAKKNGFKNFKDLDDVAANISMVMAGFDAQGNYSDPVDSLKKEMEDVKSDASIPEKDKAQTLAEMQEALKNTPPLKYKDNVTLVKKYRSEIETALQ